MSTPTDPYNSGARRPFEDEDSILEPLPQTDNGPENQDAWDRFSDASPSAETGLEPDDAAPGSPAEAPGATATLADDDTGAAPSDAAFPPAGTDTHGTDTHGTDTHGAARAASDPAEHSDNPTLASYVSDGETGAEPTIVRMDAEHNTGERRGPTRTSVMGAAATTAATATYPTPATTTAPAAGETVTSEPIETGPFMAASPAESEARRERWAEDPGDVVVEEIPAEPEGRAWAHVGTFFLTLLLVPVAWYLISDAGARLAALPTSPWVTGNPQLMPLGELAGGILVLAVIWLAARASSLGAQVIGWIVFLAGTAAVVLPRLAKDVVEQLGDLIGGYNDFTGNVVYHLGNDLGTGRIALLGAFLLLTGLVSHGARRRGQARAATLTQRQYLLSDREA
ncbi:hypothetical protein [Trueperella pecoris]|uniref:Uncharacterized protein n=1 Tax=Trueperella pecoris TaxID=2733571 RepID=A0A7M1QUG8_9ACTO|nr:hypothetical protein [Trueperella pecoris]QOQ37995.1 hypothetical protein HLG82_00065 [Trueperella pecoris]QOR45558.1 hypothetical protein INS88_09950 [Trueperella pecoris]